MAELLLAVSVSGCWYCSFWLTVTLPWPTGTLAVVSVISAFPTTVCQKVRCEKGLQTEILAPTILIFDLIFSGSSFSNAKICYFSHFWTIDQTKKAI